jgi:UDP-GlcNAc:undecaprenyl-phosphate GlcNAc-1-phosphate transferase
MIALQPTTVGAIPLLVLGGGVLVVAYAMSALVQPLVARVAIHRGLLDYPDGERRAHVTPVPRLGGIGVFAGVLVAAALGAALESKEHLLSLLPFVLSLAAGSTILFVVGLVDDLFGVRPSVKLIVQSAAALVVIRFGFSIHQLVLPSSELVSLGVLAVPITVLWIVGLSNAFNLVDGADGLAGAVATIALVTTAISALFLHDATVFWCSTALIGAMFGFLRYNLPPARIFLGDSGSLVVGFLLAVLTVKGMSRRDGAVYVVGPIFALAYPLLDTGISMLRRWLRGEPLSRADGRHIHHQLQALGFSPRQSLLILCGLSSLVAVLGISATFAPPRFTVALAIAGAALLGLILVYGARWLQYHELLEAGASLTSAALYGRGRLQDKIYARDIARLIDHANTTQELSAIIEENAETFRFAHMQLRWGISRQTPPSSVAADMQAARLWSFDYPIAGQSGFTDPLFLSVWCAVDGTVRSAGVERVTQILAPAIDRWVHTHPEQVRPTSFVETAPPVLRFGPRGQLADAPPVPTPTRGLPLPGERRARIWGKTSKSGAQAPMTHSD